MRSQHTLVFMGIPGSSHVQKPETNPMGRNKSHWSMKRIIWEDETNHMGA